MRSHSVYFATLTVMLFLLGSCGDFKSTVTQVPVQSVLNPETQTKMIKLNKIRSDIPAGTEIGRLYGGLACVDHGPLTWRFSIQEMPIAEFESIFNGVLKEAGYTVPSKSDSLFDNVNTSQVDFLVGALVKRVESNMCLHINGGKGEAYIEIEWQVFSTRSRKVLASIETAGSAVEVDLKGKTIMEDVFQAFGNATRNLLAEHRFVDLVSLPEEEAPLEATFIELVHSTDPSATKETLINNARLSTLTIIAGQMRGSGFIISRDGYVLTSYHVIGDAKSVTVKTLTGRQRLGEVIKVNRIKDVALIKLEEDRYLPLPVDDSSQQQIASEVYAIGSPFTEDLGQSISKGVISSFRSVNDQRFIQSDVNVHPGCSGGPLISLDGRVIGIAIRAMLDPIGSGVGVNYFIPIEDALEALNIVPGNN